MFIHVARYIISTRQAIGKLCEQWLRKMICLATWFLAPINIVENVHLDIWCTHHTGSCLDGEETGMGLCIWVSS